MSIEYNINDDISRIFPTEKCGEIFVTPTGDLNLICCLCGQTNLNSQIFAEHLYQRHPSIFNFETVINETVDINFLTNGQLIEIKTAYPQSIQLNIRNDLQNQSISQELDTSSLMIEQYTDIKKQPNLKLYVCQLCDKKLTSKAHLKNHLERCIKKDLPFECSYCPRSFEEKNILDRHVRTDHEDKSNKEPILKKDNLKPFKCSICNKGFLTVKSARCHKTRCEQRAIPFSCEYCPRKFFLNEKLLRHVRVKHSYELNPKIPEGHWKCEICQRLLSNSYTRKRHMLSHFTYARAERRKRCPKCGKEVSSPNALRVHMATHTEDRPLKCSFCPATFKYSTSLKTHEISHTGERKFQCQFCEKRFLTNTHRKNHELLHNKEKSLKCSQCDKKFHRIDYLNSHIKNKHTENKLKNRKFQCKICNSSFTSSKYLQNHERLHESGKEYKCKFCDKVGIVKGAIELHEKTHLKTRETFNCDLCPKVFESKNGLTNHLKSKHPDNRQLKFECGNCGRHDFLTKPDLQEHIRTVCNILAKNFGCDLCSQRYQTVYALKMHKVASHANVNYLHLQNDSFVSSEIVVDDLLPI